MRESEPVIFKILFAKGKGAGILSLPFYSYGEIENDS
jgi:hypothetical protein